MLARERLLGAVRAHRHEAEQRVEVEARQRAGVVAHAQVALGERRLRGERDAAASPRASASASGAPARIDPAQRGRRDDEISSAARTS